MGVVGPMGTKFKHGIAERPIIVSGGSGVKPVGEKPEWLEWGYIPPDEASGTVLNPSSTRMIFTSPKASLIIHILNGVVSSDEPFSDSKVIIDGIDHQASSASTPSNNQGSYNYRLEDLPVGREVDVIIPAFANINAKGLVYLFVCSENAGIDAGGASTLMLPGTRGPSFQGGPTTNDTKSVRVAMVLSSTDFMPSTFSYADPVTKERILIPIIWSEISKEKMPPFYIQAGEAALPSGVGYISTTLPTPANGITDPTGIFAYYVS